MSSCVSHLAILPGCILIWWGSLWACDLSRWILQETSRSGSVTVAVVRPRSTSALCLPSPVFPETRRPSTQISEDDTLDENQPELNLPDMKGSDSLQETPEVLYKSPEIRPRKNRAKSLRTSTKSDPPDRPVSLIVIYRATCRAIVKAVL